MFRAKQDTAKPQHAAGVRDQRGGVCDGQHERIAPIMVKREAKPQAKMALNDGQKMVPYQQVKELQTVFLRCEKVGTRIANYFAS